MLFFVSHISYLYAVLLPVTSLILWHHDRCCYVLFQSSLSL